MGYLGEMVMFGKAVWFFVLCLFVAPPATAHEPIVKSMSFEACLQVIMNTATELGTAPVNIVETSILRMVKFVTQDGYVLVACSRPDHRMVVLKRQIQ